MAALVADEAEYVPGGESMEEMETRHKKEKRENEGRIRALLKTAKKSNRTVVETGLWWPSTAYTHIAHNILPHTLAHMRAHTHTHAHTHTSHTHTHRGNQTRIRSKAKAP